MMALWLLTSQKLGVIIYAQVRKFIFVGWNIRKNLWKRDSEFVVGSHEPTFVDESKIMNMYLNIYSKSSPSHPTSHSAYVATETELLGAKIDGLLPPNFL